ncbi:hypothetical protein X975_17697, partial [Stegodyphus mimosarum]
MKDTSPLIEYNERSFSGINLINRLLSICKDVSRPQGKFLLSQTALNCSIRTNNLFAISVLAIGGRLLIPTFITANPQELAEGLRPVATIILLNLQANKRRSIDNLNSEITSPC